MKKVLNQALIKSLITSDFLLVEQHKLKQQNLRYKNSIYFAKNKKITFCLEPFEVLAILKQIIRFFQFLNKNTVYKKELHFFLDQNDTTLLSLVKTILQNKSVNDKIKFFINSNIYDFNTTSNLKKRAKVGFLLHNPMLNDKNFIRKQFNKNLFFLFQLHSNPENLLNTYKIHTNFNDYKKALFFLGFLRQLLLTVFKKKNYAVSSKI